MISSFLRFYFCDSRDYEFESECLLGKLEVLSRDDALRVKIRQGKEVTITHVAGRGARHNIQQYFYGTITEHGGKLSGRIRMDPGIRVFIVIFFLLMTFLLVFGESEVGAVPGAWIIGYGIFLLLLGMAYFIGRRDEEVIIGRLTAALECDHESESQQRQFT